MDNIIKMKMYAAGKSYFGAISYKDEFGDIRSVISNRYTSLKSAVTRSRTIAVNIKTGGLFEGKATIYQFWDYEFYLQSKDDTYKYKYFTNGEIF